MRLIIIIIYTVFLVPVLGESALVYAQGNSFAKLDFAGTTFIEVPVNWKYLDENIRKQLNIAGEATVRLAGITPNTGENVILVAANAYTSSRTPSATLRLSVRRGKTPTQAEMREASRLPRKVLSQLLAPIAEETRRVMIVNSGVKSVTTTASSVVSNRGIVCMFFEFEIDSTSETSLYQTYVCPLGERSVKLSTSYHKSEAKAFRPIIEHVWQSFQIK